MNFQFDIQQSIQISVKGIAIQLIDEAISECKSEDLKHHEIIHSVRKSCKRIRGLLRIVRPNLGSTFVEENNFFRDLGGTLSLVRDKQVLIELLEYYGKATDNTSFTIDLFMEGDKSINTKKLIENFEQKIVLRKDNINKWEVKLDGFNSLKEGIKKTYRQGRNAMEATYGSPTPENYHEWRKKAKYHYFHLELLTQIWPEVMAPLIEQAHQLSEMLGKDHDICLFKENILSNVKLNISEEVQTQILSAINTDQMNLRQKIKPLGQKVYAELPRHLLTRLEGYWNSNFVEQLK